MNNCAFSSGQIVLYTLIEFPSNFCVRIRCKYRLFVASYRANNTPFLCRAKPRSPSDTEEKDKKKERGRERRKRTESGSSSSDSSGRYILF